jgi:hypothetical protein
MHTAKIKDLQWKEDSFLIVTRAAVALDFVELELGNRSEVSRGCKPPSRGGAIQAALARRSPRSVLIRGGTYSHSFRLARRDCISSVVERL